MIKLRTWIRQTFGADAPTMWTARKWARDGKIQPKPQKVGREYYCRENAEYTARPSHSLLRRIHADEAESHAV